MTQSSVPSSLITMPRRERVRLCSLTCRFLWEHLESHVPVCLHLTTRCLQLRYGPLESRNKLGKSRGSFNQPTDRIKVSVFRGTNGIKTVKKHQQLMFTHIFLPVSLITERDINILLRVLGFSVLWPLQECNGKLHSARATCLHWSKLWDFLQNGSEGWKGWIKLSPGRERKELNPAPETEIQIFHVCVQWRLDSQRQMKVLTFCVLSSSQVKACCDTHFIWRTLTHYTWLHDSLL